MCGLVGAVSQAPVNQLRYDGLMLPSRTTLRTSLSLGARWLRLARGCARCASDDPLREHQSAAANPITACALENPDSEG